MAGSSSVVNYNVRPCKSIERKMMCDLISRLSSFDKLTDYRYVGFGAKYFADFVLIHKTFGIHNMLSMEKQGSSKNQQRFEFNKPFNCISVKYGEANNILSSTQFSWKKRSIIWLDYDGGLTGLQIQTLQTCIKKATSGSMIFFTTNADFGEKYNKGTPKDRQKIFFERVKNDEYVNQLSVKSFAGNGLYKCIQNVLSVMIEDTIAGRNMSISNTKKHITCDQIAYFNYADSSAPMVTLGWVVYSEEEKAKRSNCIFDQFEFYNPTSTPYDLTVPNFTYKELAVLNKNMPELNFPIEEAAFFEQEEVEAYKKLYRYYPTTIETNIIL